ncbi:MAG: hypothetical protein HUU50_16020 [Candidatus Brocadiae bacterium]|nr:hypothetical protein [Candidatus Brocadiia bacterium]
MKNFEESSISQLRKQLISIWLDGICAIYLEERNTLQRPYHMSPIIGNSLLKLAEKLIAITNCDEEKIFLKKIIKLIRIPVSIEIEIQLNQNFLYYINFIGEKQLQLYFTYAYKYNLWDKAINGIKKALILLEKIKKSEEKS